MAELENFSGDIFSPWICEDCQKVKLQIRGKARLYLKRNLPAALRNLPAALSVESEDEDSLLVSMEYFADSEVLALVKQWLPDIVILDNRSLVDKLKAEFDYYLERIDSGGIET